MRPYFIAILILIDLLLFTDQSIHPDAVVVIKNDTFIIRESYSVFF